MSERIEFIAPVGGLIIKNVLQKAGGVMKKMTRRRGGANPGGLPRPKLNSPYGKQPKRQRSRPVPMSQRTQNLLNQGQGDLKAMNKNMAKTANDPIPKQKPSVMGELTGGHAAFRNNPKLAHGGFMGGVFGAGLMGGIPAMVGAKKAVGGVGGAVKTAGRAPNRPYQSAMFPSTAFNPARKFSALEDLIEFGRDLHLDHFLKRMAKLRKDADFDKLKTSNRPRPVYRKRKKLIKKISVDGRVRPLPPQKLLEQHGFPDKNAVRRAVNRP